MKAFFLKTFRGYQFEFKRVLSSSIDTWYHISVRIDDKDVKYRMHNNKEGMWKITAERLPLWLYALEMEFNDAIQINEKPVPH